MCWCQRFAGKVNDPLRVGVFWGRPLREPIGEVRCEIGILGARAACLRSSTDALGSLEGPLPGWAPGVMPSDLTACLTCRGLLPAWEEFSPAGGRWVPAWEAGEGAKLIPSPGQRRAPACLLPSLGGRRTLAWEAWDAAELLPSPKGRWVPGWEVTAWEAWQAWLPAWEKLLPSPEGRRVPACLPSQEVTAWDWEAWLPAWDKLPPSPERRWAPAFPPDWVACAAKLLPSPEGRRMLGWEVTAWEAWLPAWDKLPPSPGGRWAPACLPVLEAKFRGKLVIFPSFLFSKLLNLFNCLCLT